MATPRELRRDINPYRDNVQGKANEPVTVMALLEAARAEQGIELEDCSQAEIVRRLDAGAPRIAVIGGSPDHPAHVVDRSTTLKASASLWRRGAVPFSFSIPVLCDGTAQSNVGMCYSLHSRNLASAMVVNQMEAHSYHGAFVIQGCDKTPFAVCMGLAELDVLRRTRGEAPIAATFAPAHVLRGGTIPEDIAAALREVGENAKAKGHADIAEDIHETMAHILQCASNQAFQGVLTRARNLKILSAKTHKAIELGLAANTCHAAGGICAFNGTGNSSRLTVSAIGLVHPSLELLTGPPSLESVGEAVKGLLAMLDREEGSVAHIVERGFSNAIRVHAATGGSTNLTMHLVAARIHAGIRTSLDDYDAIRRERPIPDIFDYSLTQGRDIFALAQQVERGESMGVATVLYELNRLGIPVDLDAPTMAGATWGQRIGKGRKASASRVKRNPIILNHARRDEAGIDQLRGNFFDSAVVKIAGMPEQQVDYFDDATAVVWYFENEEDATASLLSADPLEALASCRSLLAADIRRIHTVNGSDAPLPQASGKRDLLDSMARAGTLRIAVVIAGQGPKAFGMPEMFTPMHYINSSLVLRRMAMILSDGRYSGVTYGAAVGHITPEAFDRGPVAALQTGDLIWVRLRKRRIDLLDKKAWREGRRRAARAAWWKDAAAIRRIELRIRQWSRRLGQVAPGNRMENVTDAAHGVVPRTVWDSARGKKRG